MQVDISGNEGLAQLYKLNVIHYSIKLQRYKYATQKIKRKEIKQ